jgi:hypothetical protein
MYEKWLLKVVVKLIGIFKELSIGFLTPVQFQY